MRWLPLQLRTVDRMWRDGYLATQIAFRTDQPTISVINMVRRRGGVMLRLPDPVVEIFSEVTLLALTDHKCKWPTTGEGEHQLFCGKRSLSGKPYCEYHGRIAYRPLHAGDYQ